MDRFIGNTYFSNYNRIYNLKSNMDRFIVREQTDIELFECDLKSNMDRFIELLIKVKFILRKHLKSNMDRFIAEKNF